MVEAIVLIDDVRVGLIPRTKNPAAPYGKRRVRRNEGIRYLKATAENAEAVAVSGRAHPEGCFKRIEQAGKWYKSLAVKYAKLAEQM